jgi:hypothetical protein
MAENSCFVPFKNEKIARYFGRLKLKKQQESLKISTHRYQRKVDWSRAQDISSQKIN